MSDSFSVEIRGLDDLLTDLRELPGVIQKRVMLGMIATGASVIRKDAIARAPDWGSDGPTKPLAAGHPPAGTLKKAIYQVRLAELCTSVVEVWKIDVRHGKKARAVGKKAVNLDAYYASWVEYGHYTRVPMALTKSAKAAGRALGVAKWVPANPYMRPAFEAQKQAAFDAMRDYLQNNLRLVNTAMRVLKVS